MADGKARRLFAEAGLVRALGELVSDDGGVLSRSPLCQIEAIELLVSLRACYESVRAEPLPQIGTMLNLLVPPLLALLHGDGGLGNWQGAGAVEAERIEGGDPAEDEAIRRGFESEFKRQVMVSVKLALVDYGTLPRRERKSQRIFDNR